MSYASKCHLNNQNNIASPLNPVLNFDSCFRESFVFCSGYCSPYVCLISNHVLSHIQNRRNLTLTYLENNVLIKEWNPFLCFLLYRGFGPFLSWKLLISNDNRSFDATYTIALHRSYRTTVLTIQYQATSNSSRSFF